VRKHIEFKTNIKRGRKQNACFLQLCDRVAREFLKIPRFQDKKNQPSLRDSLNKYASTRRSYLQRRIFVLNSSRSIDPCSMVNEYVATTLTERKRTKDRVLGVKATRNKRRRGRTPDKTPAFGVNANTRSAFRAWHDRVCVRIYSRPNHCKSRRGSRHEFEIFPATQPALREEYRDLRIVLTPVGAPVISYKLFSAD